MCVNTVQMRPHNDLVSHVITRSKNTALNEINGFCGLNMMISRFRDRTVYL